jgi:hypothetical protein
MVYGEGRRARVHTPGVFFGHAQSTRPNYPAAKRLATPPHPSESNPLHQEVSEASRAEHTLEQWRTRWTTTPSSILIHSASLVSCLATGHCLLTCYCLGVYAMTSPPDRPTMSVRGVGHRIRRSNLLTSRHYRIRQGTPISSIIWLIGQF